MKVLSILRKATTWALICTVLNLFYLPSAVSANTNEEKLAAKVKQGISKLGTGPDAKVSIKLKNGTKLRGYISQINSDGFVVVDEKTGMSVEIPFPQTKQVKGNNLSTGAKIAIGIGIVVLILIIIGIATDGDADIV